MALVGLDYATKGRVDKVNPYKDTMRALEYIANHESKWKKSDIDRWKKQAQFLPDRSTRIRDDEWNHSKEPPTHPTVQANERHADGQMREFWNQCKYDYRDQKGKPKTDVQAANFAAVKASGEA
jgi:hypothetical protein